jgi:hypothetical protein
MMGETLESVWTQREELIYPQLFGPLSRGVFPLDYDLFSKRLGQSSVDPRWLHHGVLEYAPTNRRPSWLYVTSGTSNPWEVEPEDYASQEFSGFGTELVLEAPEQSDWAVRALQHLLAYHLLLAHGRLGEFPPLGHGDRIPLGGPIDGQPSCPIRFVIVAKPTHYAARFTLPSGAVDLLQLVGVTESERNYAKAHGTQALLNELVSHGVYPLTDPNRAAIA